MDNVKVALRIRPLVSSELDIGCRTCIERTPKEPQVTVGKGNHMFTFNYVFDEFEGQRKVYDEAVKSLIDNLFKGYNVTILAYGQTGSGKTYTMGTNYSGKEELGIIPRAVYDIFNRINEDVDKQFKVNVTFIELYNENLYDLLTQRPREQSIVEMREICGGVNITGLTEVEVNSPDEMLEKLKEGSLGRVVGATAMNAQSSRSHAIFTINIRIMHKEDMNSIVNSKFHLVDLAGSERSKKTGTTGDRFKEGININKGLLVLGNVISQLCLGNNSYINYRDSKLTRLLQDSLGGNSLTLMIACVSPADYNQDETLSTLRYADRARKIKNKPVVNQDPHLAEISRLRKENEELRLKMLSGGILECPPVHKTLQKELTDAMKKINELSRALGAALSQNTNMFERTILVENAESTFKEKLNEFIKMLSEVICDNDPHWKDIKNKMVEVQNEQRRLEREIFSLDKGDGKQSDEKEEDDTEGELPDDIFTKQRQEHIMFQAKLNNEILSLSKNLKWKEELMAKLAENSGELYQMQGISVESVEEFKQQLTELQQEKEELLKQIRNSTSHAQNASAKVAESRRKRLQELETKVSFLMKKVTEQERIIKLKEKSEEKIKKLKQEIMTMKQLKVRLIQQLKNENDKFKIFKARKDREVCQLKTQNMKKQNELKKMEQMHIKQQNVLRRKLEAAVAANKRIMAALERQKNARDKKSKGSSAEKIKERMTEELELLESEYQAQKSLDFLLQDRAMLARELAVIKASLVDESISDEEKIKLQSDAKQVEHELELRSVEISDLQQKLIDIHQDDDLTKNKWDVLQSMSDAKFALSHLFSMTSEKVKENLNKSMLLTELMEQKTEIDQQLEEYKKKISDVETYYRKAIERIEKDCEEKVNLYMQIAADKIETKDGVMSETFLSQTQELQKLEKLRKRIKELEEENARLIMNDEKHSKHSGAVFSRILKEKNSIIAPVKNKNSANINETFILDEDESCCAQVSEINNYDPCYDPDWVEETPIHKRLKALMLQQMERKRLIQDERCACIGDCVSDCKCLKSSLPCNENCSCNHSSCFISPKRLKPLNSSCALNDWKIKVAGRSCCGCRRLLITSVMG